MTPEEILKQVLEEGEPVGQPKEERHTVAQVEMDIRFKESFLMLRLAMLERERRAVRQHFEDCELKNIYLDTLEQEINFVVGELAKN